MEYRYKIWWIIGAIAGMGMICYMGYLYLPHLRIFILRIPIFLIGCFLGKKVYENQSLRLIHMIILIISLMGSYIWFKWNLELLALRNLFYIPLSFSIVLALSIIHRINQKFLRFLNLPFAFLGKYTLPIYLIHEKVQENLWRILNQIGFEVAFHQFIYQLSCIVISIAISILLSVLLSWIPNLLKRHTICLHH
ncbi:MAG: acyltransferase family protein [Prevotella sp.]|nr:acyltransferase family protein [Staphylococcus sp.]MCM1349591.1 acyltransferase family protein [Prevotella sp.]